MTAPSLFVVAAVAAAAAMAFELPSGKIPNLLVLVALLSAVALAVVDGSPWGHLGGFGLAAATAVPLYRRDYLGGGATKLLAALGAILGLPHAALTLGIGLSGALVIYIVGRLRGEPFVEELPSSPMMFASVLAAGLVTTLASHG